MMNDALNRSQPFRVTKYFQMEDSRIPLALREYCLILQKKKTLDHSITYQPSFFPICDDQFISSCIDDEGEIWVSTSTEVRRFDAYEQDRSHVQRLSGERYFNGYIKALLAEGEYIWVLTDKMVSRIQYKFPSGHDDQGLSVKGAPAHREASYGVLSKVAYQPVQLVPSYQKEMKYYSSTEFLNTTDLTEEKKQEILQGFSASRMIPDQYEIVNVIGDQYLTCFANDGETLWIGTTLGLQRINMKEADPRDCAQYLAGPRYMYKGIDRVTGLCSDGQQGVWVQNSEGIVHIQFVKKTLKQKADVLEQMIKDVHDRRGAIADISLFRIIDGRYKGYPETTDNDNLWSAQYAIGETFRYLTAKKENDAKEMAAAKQAATRAAKAAMLLMQISGRADGYPTRSYIVKEETIHGGLWFEKQAAQADGKRYALAVNTKQASLGKVKNFLITNPSIVQEAKQAYVVATGREYDVDWGDILGTDGVYPVILDRQDESKVIWRLRSEIKEEIDPVLAQLYTESGYQDSDIIYKADTSSDGICGLMPMLYFTARYLFDGTNPEDAHLKSLAILLADRLMNHIVTNGYILRDAHGNNTLWGKWFAEYFWPESVGADDCSLNGTELMSFLKIAIYLTSLEPSCKERHEQYKQIYENMWNTNYDGTEDAKGYINLMHKYIERKTMFLRQSFGEYRSINGVIARNDDWRKMINYSDENLFATPFLALIELELDEDPNSEKVAHLRGVWSQWWANMKREHNPYYTFIHQYTFADRSDADLKAAAWMLQRMPQNRTYFHDSNINRKDILLLDDTNYRNPDSRLTNRPLPPDEMYTYKYNINPLLIHRHFESTHEGADYKSGEMSAATWFTLPYWMGRYLGMLQGE